MNQSVANAGWFSRTKGAEMGMETCGRSNCLHQFSNHNGEHNAHDSSALLMPAETESQMRRTAVTESIASDALKKIEATHREISNKRIRELESLAQQIAESRMCECAELDRVMERFELLRSALLPCLIREQYVLLPAVKQRISAEQNGETYLEAYHGEFADMVRTAEGDHNHLKRLASELDREMLSLASKGFCSQKVKSFANVLEELMACLTTQFHLEDAILLPCFDDSPPKS